MGVAGVQQLGTELTLAELRKKLDLEPFPGDLELVVFVSGTVMSFTWTWPVTPSAGPQRSTALPTADTPRRRLTPMPLRLPQMLTTEMARLRHSQELAKVGRGTLL